MRAMRFFSLARRGLAVATLLGLLAVPTAALATAAVRGQVLGPAGVTPIPDAVVNFYNLVTGMTYRSEPTTTTGDFNLTGLHEGSYDVAVETDRGLWLVERAITIQPDDERVLSFALRERAYWEGADQVPPRTTPLGENIVGTAVILESEDQAGGAPVSNRRRQALIWSGVGAGVLLLVLIAGDDDDDRDEVSPFTP
jgi:hypothetical protein